MSSFKEGGAAMGTVLNLAGEWKLRRGDENETIAAVIPGDNYSALLAAGRIPHPYFRRNELEVRHLMDYDWEYTREFSLAPEMLTRESVFLNLEMVDTFADILVNGHPVGTTANQFRRYRFEVKPFLIAGVNRISVYIRSAKAEGQLLAAQQPYKVPYMDTLCLLPNINLIRKTQCSGGWDWGITLPVSGVYGDISLQAVNRARIEHVYAIQEHAEGGCRVRAVAELAASGAGNVPVTFTFAGETKTVEAAVTPGTSRAECVFEVAKPQLWWPAGYGEQPLYELTAATPDMHLTRRIGLRTLEVVNKKDEIGACLVIRINGVDIFAKGANWIPADAMPQAHTPERFRSLLESAVKANMNIIRVWGGGEYENDAFYDLCDELGVLIWHDMMFACALYPADDAFIDNVKEEVRFQVKRLRHHAALALWCGDNELLGVINWYSSDKPQRDRFLVNYDRVNRELARIVHTEDPERIFWPSSPCGGPGIFNDGWHDDSCGDMHYWEVWHGAQDFNAFYKVKPRFCSEFGFQSFPSLETVETYALPEDYNVFSPVMDHHQKCMRGNISIIGMFGTYFRMPESFPAFLYLSQVQQALAIKIGVEYWRSLRPRCMGTIFWQLNDNWPVASWASLEYGGRWKQLQYQAKRFYAPVMATVYRVPGENTRIALVSDIPGALRARVKATVRDFAGKVLKQLDLPAEFADAGSRILLELAPSDIPGTPETVFLELETTARSADGKTFTHHNTFFPAPYKSCNLAKAKISHRVDALGNNRFRIALSTDAPAFFVWLAVTGDLGLFDDNSFTLLPDCPMELVYEPKQPHTADELQQKLRITHLRDTYTA